MYSASPLCNLSIYRLDTHHCHFTVGIFWATEHRRLLRINILSVSKPWWRHQLETVSALLPLCVGNPSVTDGFPSQRVRGRWFPSQRASNAGFEVFYVSLTNSRVAGDLRRWFAHCDVTVMIARVVMGQRKIIITVTFFITWPSLFGYTVAISKHLLIKK